MESERKRMKACYWREAYSNLNRFIVNHPDVMITSNNISIPECNRSEFYSLFNYTREIFINELLKNS
jgi:hypothetical protein